MTEKQTKVKAKRVLKELTFEHEGAAVALVGPATGGPANGIPVLTYKASKFTDEHIAKASQIKVTMEITEFLQKFYGLWYEDAETLARALGFTTKSQDYAASTSDAYTTDYEDYITSKVQSIEVIKALYEAEKLSDVLSTLDPDQYLAMLEDQAVLEKAFEKIQKNSIPDKGEDTSNIVHEVNKSEVKASSSVNKKEIMTTQQDTPEMVEKSAFAAIQKSLEDNKVELQKALDTIAKFEQEKKEAVVKAKSMQLQGIIKDEKIAEPLLKAALSLESEDDFTAFLAAITAMQANIETSQAFIEKSAMFQEQGVSTSEEIADQESPVARILKAKLAK